MTKDEYLLIRSSHIELLYLYYIERCKDNCLQKDDFGHIIRFWPQVDQAYSKIVREYDQKFEVIQIEDMNTGNILKVY